MAMRFDFELGRLGTDTLFVDCIETSSGMYVTYTDYAILETRCLELEAALRAAREFLPSKDTLPLRTKARIHTAVALVDAALAKAEKS